MNGEKHNKNIMQIKSTLSKRFGYDSTTKKHKK